MHPKQYSKKRKKQTYTPNHISSEERALSIIFSSILLVYGTIGIIIDDLYLPGKGGGVHFHGEPMWVMLVAFGCAIANLLSVVVDHYGKRNNETNYLLFARFTRIAGFVMFGLALFLDLFVFPESTR